jgi:hypothetical protein
LASFDQIVDSKIKGKLRLTFFARNTRYEKQIKSKKQDDRKSNSLQSMINWMSDKTKIAEQNGAKMLKAAILK